MVDVLTVFQQSFDTGLHIIAREMHAFATVGIRSLPEKKRDAQDRRENEVKARQVIPRLNARHRH